MIIRTHHTYRCDSCDRTSDHPLSNIRDWSIDDKEGHYCPKHIPPLTLTNTISTRNQEYIKNLVDAIDTAIDKSFYTNLPSTFYIDTMKGRIEVQVTHV